MTMQQRIESTLGLLQPEHLQVLDESHMHSRGLQTHFKAVVVSAQFDGLNRVKRHQKVYGTLGELMGEFHALALHTYTPQEWAEIGAAPASPTCAGGSLSEAAIKGFPDAADLFARIRNAPLTRRVFFRIRFTLCEGSHLEKYP